MRADNFSLLLALVVMKIRPDMCQNKLDNQMLWEVTLLLAIHFYSLLLLMSDDTMHNRFSLDTSGNHLEAVKQEINGITKKNSPGKHKMMKLLIVFESCKEWIWHSEVFVLEVETEKDQEINERIICMYTSIWT